MATRNDLERFTKIKVQPKPKPTRYVVTDKEGNATAFYNSDMHDTIPPEAVKISEEHYKQFHDAYAVHPRVHHRFIKGKIAVHDPILSKYQLAIKAIQDGLTVSIPRALKPTKFKTDLHSINKLLPVLAVLSETGKFPGGSDKFPMRDDSGAWVVLNIAQYKAIVIARSSYWTACRLASEGCTMVEDGGEPTNGAGLPPPEVILKV